jgi:hypothetical protein
LKNGRKKTQTTQKRIRSTEKNDLTLSLPNSCLGTGVPETLFRPSVGAAKQEFRGPPFPNRSLATRAQKNASDAKKNKGELSGIKE